ncbi:hypothetical protein Hanom_Chr05g00393481 [Helianthus anomalus]
MMNRIKEKSYYKEDSRYKVLSRKEARREKNFVNKEIRLRNSTSFYISNLPGYCTRTTLWRAFEHLDNWKTSSSLSKQIKSLKEIRIDGAVIDFNLAKFSRDGSKIEEQNKEGRVSVFSRLQEVNPGTYHARAPKVDPALYQKKKTYCSVVNPCSNDNFAVDIELPPMNTKTKKKGEFKSLIDEVKEIVSLNNLKENLSGIMEENFELRYPGVLKCSFVLRARKKRKSSDWHVINRIGERCGRHLVKSKAEACNGNMAEDRLAVLVHTGKRISLEFTLSWKEHKIKVWVEEIVGQWCSDFLKEKDPEMVCLGRSTKFDYSPASDIPEMNSRGCESPTCMENPKVFLSPITEVDEPDVGIGGGQDLSFVSFNEERETEVNIPEVVLHGEQVMPPHHNDVVRNPVGPEEQQRDNEGFGGHNLEPTRPTYITKRPKRVSKSKVQA